MSHWKAGKISLGCSLGILKAALRNMRKDWKIVTKEDQDVELDAKGGLTAETNWPTMDNQGHKQGMDLVIRRGSGGVHGADIGFKKLPDGTWSTVVDYLPDGMSAQKDKNEAETLEIMVKSAIASLKVRMIANQRGNKLVSDVKQGNKRVIEFDTLESNLGGPTAQGMGV